MLVVFIMLQAFKGYFASIISHCIDGYISGLGLIKNMPDIENSQILVRNDLPVHGGNLHRLHPN